MHKVAFLLLLLLTPSSLRAAPDVSFADLAAGRAAIVDDPGYFDRLQPMEMEAKTGQPLPVATLARQRAECRCRYQAAVRPFGEDEKTAIRGLVALLDPAIRKNYPQFAETPWNFLKVSRQSGSRVSAHPRQTYRAGRKCLPLDARRPAPWQRTPPAAGQDGTALARADARLSAGARGGLRLALYRSVGLRAGQDDCHLPLDHRASVAQPRCRGLPVGLSHPPPRRHAIHLADLLVSRRSRPEADANGILDAGRLRNQGRRRIPRAAIGRRPAEVFRTDERAGLSRGLSAVDQHLSSARSGRRFVCQAGGF